jgi:hypothetical protein
MQQREPSLAKKRKLEPDATDSHQVKQKPTTEDMSHQVGDIVLCKYGKNLEYKAKIINITPEGYEIHYQVCSNLLLLFEIRF